MKKEIAFFSNHMELLYERLKKHLLSHLSFSSPFYVLVPSDKVKQWLMVRLARDCKIASGLCFLPLFEMSKIFKKSSFPSSLELELLLQEKIATKLEQREEIFQPLLDYVQEKGVLSQKKLSSLTQELASFFSLYGLFGREMVALWEKEPTSWQEALWREIFVEEKREYPARDLLVLEEIGYEKEMEIHLFAPSFLPLLYRQQLLQLSQRYPIHYYFLSPTFCFWEDVASDRERCSLLNFWKKKGVPLERREELDQYLQDRNPLLANWGKMGREMLKNFSQESFQIEEDYQPIERDSLLHSLQEELLSLKNPKNEAPTKIEREDLSLQIHKAPSQLREVEILHDYLLQEIDKTKVDFSKILILAPDISLYEAKIHQVFGQGKIPYKIADMEGGEKSDFVRGFKDFFHLLHSRWKKEELFSFLGNPLLLRKHSFSFEEIRTYIERAQFRWGIDSEHRSSFLKTTEEKGSWKDVLDQICQGFVLCQEEKDPFGRAFFFEKSAGRLFEPFFALFEKLKEDLFFLEQNPFMTLEIAADFLEQIADFYFAVDEEKLEEAKPFSRFTDFLRKMRLLAKKFEGKKFTIETFFTHLFNEMEGSLSFHNSSLEAVSFASLQEGALLPSSILCLLGMGEEFPREEKSHSLNALLAEKKREYFPNQKEKDRALFLEALLSARKTLYISFTFAQEEKEGLPLLLTELLSYIKTGYSFEKGAESHLVKNAPLLSFDCKYFQEKGKEKSFSQNSFRAAKSYYGPKKTPQNFWEQEFAVKEESIVDVKSLELLAFHPVKFFFQKSLKIFLEEEREELFLSSWEKANLRSLFLKKGKEELLKVLEKKNSLPSGMAGEIFQKEIEKELSSYEENLLALEVDRKKILSLEMIDGCEKPQQKEGGWIVPPIELSILERRVKIIGRIDGICKEGLLHHGRGDFFDCIRIWPRFLLALQFPFLEKKELLFSKTGRKREVALEDSLPLLSLYLQYYEKSKKKISPLLREWSEPLLLGQEEGFQKIIDQAQEIKKEEDAYLHRLFFLSEKPKASFLKEEWLSLLSPLYSPLKQLFTKKTKKELKNALL